MCIEQTNTIFPFTISTQTRGKRVRKPNQMSHIFKWNINREQTSQDKVLVRVTHRGIESQALWEIKHISVLQTSSYELHASDRLYMRMVQNPFHGIYFRQEILSQIRCRLYLHFHKLPFCTFIIMWAWSSSMGCIDLAGFSNTQCTRLYLRTVITDANADE